MPVISDHTVNVVGVSTLAVLKAQDTTLSSLDVTGATTLEAGAAISKGATVTGGLLTDFLTSGPILGNAGAQIKGNLTADTITTSGAAYFGGLVVASAGLQLTGALKNDAIETTGAMTAGGLLTANAGAKVIGGLECGSLTDLGAATIGGAASFKAGVTIEGQLEAKGGASVSNGIASLLAGASVTKGLTTDSLTASGLATLKGSASVAGGLTTDSLTASGKATLNGGASVSNDLSTETVTASGKATLKGGASVKGGLITDTVSISGIILVGDLSSSPSGCTVGGSSSCTNLKGQLGVGTLAGQTANFVCVCDGTAWKAVNT